MRAELLDEDGDLSPACKQALYEIFDRYDKDGDGALNDAEIQAFARDTNGSEFSRGELDEIRGHLECTDDGALCREGFLELYHLQTSAGDEDETWKDLKKHGYDDSLRLVQSGAKDA
ncbi:hypothetical protein H4R21_002085 [Coemansia helicoidea]|uniref:Uncharacterized protein n=1 Tax=Coemansia helicoidea TaxID=1286919 RepID=A0ACC1L918_9FUNG|nr:hypothetical protein H4R21_002085 [Coemansia helicoidea]